MKAGTDAQRRAMLAARWILGACLAVLGFWVAQPFLLQIAFGAILAIAVWPLYRESLRTSLGPKRRIFVPLAFTLAIGLLLVLPLAILGAEAVRDSVALEQWFAQANRNGVPSPHWLASLPMAGAWLDQWWRQHLANPHGAAVLLGRVDAGAVAGWLGTLAYTLLSWSMFLLVTLLALFIILRDGDRLATTALTAGGRIYGEFGERFVRRLAEAIRGTVNGTVLVAFGEGLLIGLGYAVAKLPHPIAFTVATIGFCFIPFGAWVAFGVASLLLAADGSALAGVLLFGYSSVVMLVGDNLVEPAVIGNSIRLPFLWTFVGIFGGMYSFGLVGLFVGPAIMAAVYLVWSEWHETPAPARTAPGVRTAA